GAQGRAVQDLLGAGVGPLAGQARPVHPQHARRACGARADVGGRCGGVAAAAALARPASGGGGRAGSGLSGPSGTEEPLMRIGDVARAVGTTTRTIRYYEEIGLLEPSERRSGAHREYTEADVERVREILRFKDLLGVSLDELRELIAAEDARRAIREEFPRTEDPVRRRQLLEG